MQDPPFVGSGTHRFDTRTAQMGGVMCGFVAQHFKPSPKPTCFVFSCADLLQLFGARAIILTVEIQCVRLAVSVCHFGLCEHWRGRVSHRGLGPLGASRCLLPQAGT